MKKEIIAVAALVILLGLSVFNIYHMDNLAQELLIHVDASQNFAENGDFDSAEEELRKAIDLWAASDGYTHIFIRHPEIDGATDAFYELLSDVRSGDLEASVGSYEKVQAHIKSIAGMEHITIGSIL